MPDQLDDMSERPRRGVGTVDRRHGTFVGRIGTGDQLPADGPGMQDMIVHMPLDDRVRHGVMQRRQRILNDDNAAGLPDERGARGSIHAGA